MTFQFLALELGIQVAVGLSTCCEQGGIWRSSHTADEPSQTL
jgi:hypothetical protein